MNISGAAPKALLIRSLMGPSATLWSILGPMTASLRKGTPKADPDSGGWGKRN